MQGSSTADLSDRHQPQLMCHLEAVPPQALCAGVQRCRDWGHQAGTHPAQERDLHQPSPRSRLGGCCSAGGACRQAGRCSQAHWPGEQGGTACWGLIPLVRQALPRSGICQLRVSKPWLDWKPCCGVAGKGLAAQVLCIPHALHGVQHGLRHHCGLARVKGLTLYAGTQPWSRTHNLVCQVCLCKP